MNASRYHRCRFLTSADSRVSAPPDHGAEVAFAGRSNAGKSSAINTIVEQRNLARTSKTPGRTQLLNFFAVDETRRLVDLPGYGYAKVSERIRSNWHRSVEDFLANRRCLSGVIIAMDIRHPLTDFDRMMINWCRDLDLPAHLLLTKADKLGRGAAKAVLLQTEKALQTENYANVSAQIFSSPNRSGVETAHRVLDRMLGFEDAAGDAGKRG